ncbi:MAG: cycloinulo-oligosaccharide fructanotransferase [Phycisphaera sp. RhM]|nr:cycloinulo-oligosaccharide fructanotransferase [Phycisphaera sp. RhM]
MLSRFLILLLLGVVSLSAPADDSVHWSLDAVESPDIQILGDACTGDGVDGKCLVLDGETVIEAKGFESAFEADELTLTIWVNPYALDRDQQMIAAKNRYSLDEREWSLMVDRDGRFRLYLWQGRWLTVEGPQAKPGRWHQVGLVMKRDRAELFVDGALTGTVTLEHPIRSTGAPLTFGGVNDDGQIRQTFLGALDEAQFVSRALKPDVFAARYRPVTATHPIPKPAPPYPLWDPAASRLKADALPQLNDVEFHVIKQWDKPRDGYTFLHGVSLAWHSGRLFASFGHNRGAENTVSEEAQYRVSDDGGKTWGPLQLIDAGDEENLAVSHGVFLSHDQTLWAFHGAYYGRMDQIHTRAYRLEAATGNWQPLGVVLERGFWPMNQPVPMADGNWIMPGFLGKRYSGDAAFPAAVAISHGDDFTRWDLMPIPVDNSVKRMWGESSLFVDGKKVFNLARYGGAAVALAATSEDYGRTWSASRPSNLPMATSKPAAGVLSTGQRYLVCTTAEDNGGKRTPLTIAVSRPNENQFSRVFVIRRSRLQDQPGESAENLSLSYPCAVEHDGKLYVGYSNNGGRRGNLNSAELAVIPVEALRVR